jgi:WhiB family redox-sensing transcriptional regulator
MSRVCFVADCSADCAPGSPNFCREHFDAAERWRAQADRDGLAMERQVGAAMSGGAVSGGVEDNAPMRPTRRTLPSEFDPVRLPLCRRPSWWEGAACRRRGYAVDVFLPERETQGSTAQAKAICRTCPVIADCLADALTPMELHGHAVAVLGVWGGLTTNERASLRADRHRTVSSGVAS